MNSSVPALSISHVSIAYHHEPIVFDLSVTIPSGVMAAVIGPNGAGKTTLIKSILGLVKPIAGTIQIYGKKLHSEKNMVAYVPQRAALDWDFPLTVIDVVVMGSYAKLGWFSRPSKKEYQEAMRAIETVGLSAYAHQPIGELSGGQQQRMLVARALVQNSDLYILDEPFAGVDMATEQLLQGLLKSLADQGKTIIVVHHDLHTVKQYFNWALLLNKTLVAAGPLDQSFTQHNVLSVFGRELI